MGEGTLALPVRTHIAWTGSGNPEEVFKAFALEVGEATVWIPTPTAPCAVGKGTSHAKPWHFYDVEARAVVLPEHNVALVLSPSNAEGTRSWRHPPDCHWRHHGRARHANRTDLGRHSNLALKLGDGAPHLTASAPL